MNIRQPGFVTLLTIIVIGAVTTTIVIGLLLLGTDNLKATQYQIDSAHAAAHTDSCAEKALNSLKGNAAYAGGETVNFTNGSCLILPLIGAGTQTPTIRIEGTVSSVKRRVEISVKQVSPQIKLNYWRELADFTPL